MNEVEVIMFQADCGDSFLVTIKSEKEINILIDCGTRDTYYNCIKPKLVEMKNHNRLLDFVILTHMHADHIEGALYLFKENVSNDVSNIIKIENIIYNGIKGLQISNYENGTCDEYDKAVFEGVLSQGKAALQGEGGNVSQNISMKQELFLSSYILKGGYRWNSFSQFTDGIILADDLPKIEIDNNTSITFLSPNAENLKNLNQLWEKSLKKIRKKITLIENDLTRNAYEAYMYLISRLESEQLIHQISQESVINTKDVRKLSKLEIEQDTKKIENGSSIAFMLTFKDKNLLFLGDSFSEIYYKNLLRLKKEGMKTYFDLIKVSHHGSKFNICDEFLENFDSAIYLISTNGKYDHPDIETISKIINRKIDISSNDQNRRSIIISNETQSIKKFDKKILKDEFNYTIRYLSNESIIIK
ncbi:MBL fold metallo-hydrolase [Clostridium felsineum]|uniref:MBL fold metallo-hydrolase n=1 Tax=Clostridium felsineum TaxID=36839 RepID=UPI00098C5197|nr:MBL fold metallo-hydrolase [Clostridium felsineum]URZ16689.1 hypothetical protein CLFE_027360 [Clostridium felsineum DSM 794]